MQISPNRLSYLLRGVAVLFALGPGTAGASLTQLPLAEQGKGTPGPASALERALLEAEAALDAGEEQLAESRYRSALLEGWMLLGSLDIEDGKLADAEAAFRRAATSAVESRRPLTSLALVVLERGDSEQALSTLRSLVVQDPSDLAARRLLARALAAAGRLDEAVQELEQLAVLDPENLENTFLLATAYLRQGKPESAEPHFVELAKRRPIAPTWVLIGRVQRDFGNYERAREALEKALELDPKARRAHHYLGSVALLDQGRGLLDEAMGHFEAELELAPNDPLANLHLGIGLVEKRRYQEAVERLERARAAGAPESDALQFLGQAYLAIGRPEDAVDALTRALELAREEALDPEQDSAELIESQIASLHYQLALALRRTGDEAAAAPHFEASKQSSARVAESSRRTLDRYLRGEVGEPRSGARESLLPPSPLSALSPRSRSELRGRISTAMARSYLNLGVLRIRKQQHARAAELFEQAVQLDSDLPQVHYSLGVALFNAGRFERAAAPLALAFEKRPTDANLRRMLALTWLNSGSPEGAALLLRDDPARETERSLQYAYGLALVRSGRSAEAEAIFARLLTENADWPELNVVLGQAHAQQDDYDSAIGFLTKALELDPGVAEAHATLGDIYLRQGELEKAEAELRAELLRHPDDHRALYTLAVVLDLARKGEEALEVLESLLASRPRTANGRYLMGKILLARGEEDRALEQLLSAVELAPNDPNIRYQLGRAYQKLGRTEEAQVEFDAFRRLKDESRSGAGAR